MLCNVERKKRTRNLIRDSNQAVAMEATAAVTEVVVVVMEAVVADSEVAVVADTVVAVNQDMEAVEAVCHHKIGQTLDNSKTYLQMQDLLTLTWYDQECSQAVCLQVVCHQVECVQVAAVHQQVCDQEVHLRKACAHQVEFHLEEALLRVVTRVISLATLSASEIVYSFL